MGAYILRRLVQGIFTLFGVMLLTFVLFRGCTGDVSATFVNPKLGKKARQDWLKKNKLDLPMVLNFQRRMKIVDTSSGTGNLSVRDRQGSKVVTALLLEQVVDPSRLGQADASVPVVEIESQAAQWLDAQTPLTDICGDLPWSMVPKPTSETQPTQSAPRGPPPGIIFTLRDGSTIDVDLSELARSDKKTGTQASSEATFADIVRIINEHPDNNGRLVASISSLTVTNVFNAQFFWHMSDSVQFKARSFKTEELLLDVIAERARYSLSITVPSMAVGWLLGMVISALVAYYRGRPLDKIGVFLCVLGMCIPYLVYMIVGQKLIFEVSPTRAWGLHQISNIYVPVAISVAAGLGGSVRFYRTVILDEVKRDYVRTARAKGVPLPGILFRHVLKNCMLPILTAVVVSIPYLVMGSLLLEQFFGVNGLGNLAVTAVSDRDVPIISGLTFLTAAIYIVGLLVTDILYAVFDPRIRLK